MNKKSTLILVLCILLLSLILAACAATATPLVSGFEEPDPAEYVNLAPIVWEYFHRRKAAVLSGNLDAFYVRYPELILDAEPLQGINAEAFHAAGLQSFDLMDGDIFPEYYEPLRVKTLPDHVEILTHGVELYLHRDAAGSFNQTGGEFKIILYLRPDGEGWTLFRTHEVTLAEWKDFNP